MQQVTYLEPGNADAWNELGFSYRNVENYRQSDYTRALGLDPEHLGALNYQGYLLLRPGGSNRPRKTSARWAPCVAIATPTPTSKRRSTPSDPRAGAGD